MIPLKNIYEDSDNNYAILKRSSMLCRILCREPMILVRVLWTSQFIHDHVLDVYCYELRPATKEEVAEYVARRINGFN